MDFQQVQENYLTSTKLAEEFRMGIDGKVVDKLNLIAKKEAQIEKLNIQIMKLQKSKYQEDGYVSWIDALVEPIAKHFADKFEMNYKIYGAFGMRAQTSIYWFNLTEDGQETDLKVLSIIPLDLNKSLLGYETGFYKDGVTPSTYDSNDPNEFNREVKELPNTFEEIQLCIR